MKKSIIPRIITAYQDDAYRWEIHRAMMDFFDETNKDAIAQQLKENPDVEGWFNEWLIYDFRLENGKTILEDFVERNPLQLSDAELDAYRDLLSSESGFFEILEVKRKKSLRLKSITTDHEYLVSESQGTLGVQERRMIYGRVGRVEIGRAHV